MGHPPAPAEQEALMANQKHLDLKSRYYIEHALDNRQSFKAIAAELDKDATTISKEVRNHKVFQKTGSHGRVFNDCANRNGCTATRLCPSCTRPKNFRCCFCGRCASVCLSYQKEICKKLSKPPYVCNGCESRNNCTLEKALYRAMHSQNEYSKLLSEARTGYNITEEELAHLDSLFSPRLKNGQSIHHICANHMDEVMYSEKTIYTYVNDGLLDAKNIDMPRKVRLRPRKGKKNALKVDKACRTGRTFQDYLKFRQEHPDLPVVELDTVEGIKGGAVLLTVHFVIPKLQLAFKRASNDSQSVIDIFNRLYLEMRPDIFMDTFPILLCDNGSEFSNPSALEFDSQGNRRAYVFYCDPSAPNQKGACENNHEFIRRVIPHGTDIGLYSDPQILLMMSHINSYRRKELGDKNPYEMYSFLYGEDRLKYFGLEMIPGDDIILTPALLKSKSTTE